MAEYSDTIESLNSLIYDLEQRLEVALLCANQVWWEWDIPTGILKTHAVKDCILGYDLGKIRHHLDFWMDALPPEEREPVWRSLQEHIEGKGEMWSMEHRYKNPEGEYKWVLEAGKVVTRTPDGSALRMVGITQNIHDKKMKDEELKRKNESLTEALKLRDIVLAGASHDVKNALNSGLGLAQLLSEDDIGKTEQFAIIHSSLEKSAELISKFHEISKGHLYEAEPSLVNIDSIIEDSRAFHALNAKNKQLDLKTNTLDGNFAMTDKSIVRRIIDNLVGNAIKFTKSGYISINDISDSDTVIIEVTDMGPGIPPDRRDQLFVPFNKFTDESHGSGLGLSISRNLVEKLFGKVSYRPNTPSGSIFRLEIPRELAHAAETGNTR